MKKLIFAVAGCFWLMSLQAAEAGVFSGALKGEEFSEAGLSKLTPQELAKLNALVEAYGKGALAAITQEKIQAETSAAAARAEALAAQNDAKAAKAEVEKSKEGFFGGLWSKSKVVLKPGTQIEYEASDSMLPGEFKGWRPGTLFTLENGQRWRVIGDSSYSMRPEPGPRKVRVVPGTLGSFFLEIEGVRQKPKVEFAGTVN